MEAENAEIIIVDEEKGLGDHDEDVSIKSSRENEAKTKEKTRIRWKTVLNRLITLKEMLQVLRAIIQ